MSCRKAFETDLAEFTLEPSAPGFADFRQHVADCADCTAEVSVWTELGRQLTGGMRQPEAGHPSEELLLRFGDGKTASPEERRVVERHLKQCPTCRDELRSLQRFDFASLLQASPELPVSPHRETARIVAWLRQLLVHPAFAYGLVVLLIMPTVLTRFGLRPGVSPRIEYERQARDRVQADSVARSVMEETEGRADSPASLAVDDGRAASRSLARREADSLEGERRWLSGDNELRADEVRGFGQSSSVEEKPPSFGAPEAATAEKAEAAFLDREMPRDVPVGRRGAGNNLHGVEELGRAKDVGRKSKLAARQALAPLSQTAEGIEFSPAGVAEPATLIIRLPEGASPRGPVEVRVASVDGWRELRQRIVPSPSAVEVEVVLPADWLAAGPYRVELHAVPLIDGAEPLDVYHVNVP